MIAFRKGSMPELIEDGKTGFIVDNVEHGFVGNGCLNSLLVNIAIGDK